MEKLWMLFLIQGHILLQSEKVLLAECYLLPVFPYKLHWISSVQTQTSDPVGEQEEG